MERHKPKIDFSSLYDQFEISISDIDCGMQCSTHNPTGKPFCCDICQAIPVAYHQEWEYLRLNTDLWHIWKGNECHASISDAGNVREEVPENMVLLACLGPEDCQRQYRAMSCRQFPFFPYITSDYRFLGMAYDWFYEESCWVISHLECVTGEFRQAFFDTYDYLFAVWDDEFESYFNRSQEMRSFFKGCRRRIPILHRNGAAYLISPGRERMERVAVSHLPRFGPYR